MKKIIIGITGGSGHLYTKKLIKELINREILIYIVASKEGKNVFQYETDISLEDYISSFNNDRVTLFHNDNLFAPIASGSFISDAMVIIPCSMNTVGCIANGITNTLLTRTADVMQKEKRELIILPREMPMNTIHLENLTKLSNLGVRILPCSPGFYNKPETLEDIINFVVGKVFDALNIENNIYKRWE